LTGRAKSISAADAIVAAIATTLPSPVVLTSDPVDLTALLGGSTIQVRVAAV
jgi:hypothetical protein